MLTIMLQPGFQRGFVASTPIVRTLSEAAISDTGPKPLLP
jgi:hypothetical protein